MSLLPYGATRVVGNSIGAIAAVLRTRPVKTTEANLRYCYPRMRDAQREALARASLKHTGRLLAETGLTFHGSAKKIASLITEVEGWALVESSLAVKRGILVLVPHFGNWELFALHFGRYEFLALYDPPRIASLDALIKRARERTGAKLFPIDGHGVRNVLQALKRGQPVSLLPDQVPTKSAGVYAPFFNRPALTMTFAHRLIRSANPLVLIGACRRNDRGFTISFTEAPAEIYATDVEESVAAMNKAIEVLIAEAPAQYQWEYKRFKKPPAGGVQLYRE